MKKIITIVFFPLLLLPAFVVADTSDYIWNMQFEQKIGLAEQGDKKAQYDVGNMYLKGQGTARDAEKAFDWYQKAADQGYVRAIYKIGFLYHKGEGVKKNNGKAFDWIKRAAEQDYRPAMYYLGKLYASGAGTKKNLNAALEWYEKAEKAGYHPAKKAIANVKKQIASAPKPASAARSATRTAPARSATKTAPSPVPAAKKRKTAASPNLLSTLIASKWQQDGEPADMLPSAVTECSVRNGLIACASEEINENQPFGVVTYRMESMIGNFKGNKFSVQYRKNITLIFPNEPDNPNLKIPLDYGPQPPVRLDCELVGDKDVSCQTPDNKSLVYVKL
ncbi:MAG: tetratricopeptide repeat protein [Granulosicoccaceae bacterium]|jgi:hypothetical protein